MCQSRLVRPQMYRQKNVMAFAELIQRRALHRSFDNYSLDEPSISRNTGSLTVTPLTSSPSSPPSSATNNNTNTSNTAYNNANTTYPPVASSYASLSKSTTTNPNIMTHSVLKSSLTSSLLRRTPSSPRIKFAKQ